ncbi:hypothetical protein JRQ81_006257 [Phrynocephalus forsythii]|uniref:C-factor-like n=1 Tax=Phrynocephalus forsythii TaxID=171643 RepID=A0A9Q1AUT8_9SAUR|nr:hypothetical protein JRQ81_006257 [Phrynocephalus forsythii]
MAPLTPCNVLVTGCSRGIGLELVKQMVGKTNRPQKIFATCRDPAGPQSQELKKLADKHQGLEVIPLDVCKPSSIKAAAARVTERLQGAGLNLLINNAGMVNGKSTLELATPEDMLEVYNTNVVGPMLVSQAFVPLLKKGAQESLQKGMSCSKAAIVNISSIAGSIDTMFVWESGQVISYRCSKAALNMLTKCQSLGYAKDEILCVPLHPGWLQTDMGNVAMMAPTTVEEGVQKILDTLSHLSEKDAGTFVDLEGKVLPCRGIGLELVKQLIGKPNRPEKIFATCRDPAGPQSQELKKLSEKHQGLEVIALDVCKPSTIKAAAAKVTEQLRGAGLNLLINNAGIVNGKSTLEMATPEDMLEVYTTNVVGPMLVSQAFVPLLKKGAQESPQKGMSCSKAAIVNVTSIGGSIATMFIWEAAPVISYRCSKAALNMLSKCQSLEYAKDEILCVPLHPGWLQTDLAGKEAPMTVEEGVQKILNTLSQLSEKDSGTFVDLDGKVIPW